MSKRDEFVTLVLSQLCEELSGEQIEVVKQVLNTAITDYEIEVRNTSIIPSDGFVPHYYGLYIARKKIAGRTDATIRLYNYYLIDFFLNKPAPIEHMDSSLMVRYLYDYKKRKKISNSTLDQVRIIMNGFFEWASNEGYIARNFVANIDPIKHIDKPRQPLTEEEMVMLRDACETYRERAIIDTFLYTGIRIAELANMKWSDIDMQRKTIKIFGKGSKYRTVIFNSTAKISLLKYKLVQCGDSEYVFLSEKKPYNKLCKGAIGRIISDIDKRTEFSHHVSAHVLRHTFATQALIHGMSIEKMRILLGHENYSTTLLYAEIDMSQVEYEYKKSFGA